MILRNGVTAAVVSLAVATWVGCGEQPKEGAQNPEQTANGGEVSGGSAMSPEEEQQVLEESGDNQLGINTDDYDMAVVVDQDQSFSLAGEDGEDTDEAEDGDATAEDEGDEGLPDEEEAEDEKAEDEEEEGDEEEGDGGVEPVTEEEIAKCSKHFDKAVTGVHVSGNKKAVEVERSQYIAVKMAGNQSSISLLLAAEPEGSSDESEDTSGDESSTDDGSAGLDLNETEEGDTSENSDGSESEGSDDSGGDADVQGVCIIAAGNQPQANIVVNGISVGDVYYSAAGNGAEATFEVGAEASLGSFKASMTGNAGALTVTGDGSYSCEDISVSGNAAEPSCG